VSTAVATVSDRPDFVLVSQASAKRRTDSEGEDKGHAGRGQTRRCWQGDLKAQARFEFETKLDPEDDRWRVQEQKWLWSVINNE
jgi:hypothetical protein